VKFRNADCQSANEAGLMPYAANFLETAKLKKKEKRTQTHRDAKVNKNIFAR